MQDQLISCPALYGRHEEVKEAPMSRQSLASQGDQLTALRYLEHLTPPLRIGEERRREAVGKVAAMQFDQHGNRIWCRATLVLHPNGVRHEHSNFG